MTTTKTKADELDVAITFGDTTVHTTTAGLRDAADNLKAQNDGRITTKPIDIDGPAARLPADRLAAALANGLKFAGSDEDDRPDLCCLRLEADTARLRITATDGQVAIEQDLRWVTPLGFEECGLTLSRSSAALLFQLANGAGKEEGCQLALTDDGLVMEALGAQVTVPVMEAMFPNTGQLFDHARKPCDGVTLLGDVLARLGKIKLPGVKASEVVVSWAFSSVSVDGPPGIEWAVRECPDGISVRGAAVSLRA